MMKQDNTAVLDLVRASPEGFMSHWIGESSGVGDSSARAWRKDAQGLLSAFEGAVSADADLADFADGRWDAVRAVLEALSASGAAQGSSAGETSHFVLAFKRPLFSGAQRMLGSDPQRAFDMTWRLSTLVDRMAQWTATTYQQTREEVIRRQQDELLELSTPVVKLWEGVLAVPMIGTLDSNRTQLVMETLLERIVETGADVAIVDITGVPTVDTLVAQHLLKTVAAIRLMGAECIISGIRPQIAQTIVHLGIDLQGVKTKATLADALSLALKRSGWSVARAGA
jgi:rsbT co-antagonist protein RsbR